MKVLLFAPHSEVWVHAFPEALIAEALKQEGHEIVYVSCGSAFVDFCIPMGMRRLTPESDPQQRAAVCASCTANARVIREAFGFAGFALADRLTDEDRAAAQAELERVTPGNLADLTLDGIPIGRYALYELLLLHKVQDLQLGGRLWSEYRIALKHCLHVYFAFRRILSELRPDRVLVCNGLYSVNRVCSAVAARAGIPNYFTHAGGNLSRRLQTLMICRGQNIFFFEDAVARWPAFRDRPCPAALQAQITDHFLELLGGRSNFAYSHGRAGNGADIRSFFGIKPEQRVLTATMSSPDERYAAEMVGAMEKPEGLLFPSQLEWIDALIAFVAKRQDLFLIIRVHPREFPNKRETVQSQHSRVLEEKLRALPPNARVNWPDQKISLYSLPEHTDVFLNSWSSAGKEMALLGRPVVLYSRDLVLYPPDINYVGTTLDGYFAQIERALAEGWNAERIRTVYRWLAVEYGYALIDISESYAQRENQPDSLPRRALRRSMRLVDSKYSQKKDCQRRAPSLAARRLINDVVAGNKTSVLEAGSPDRLGSNTLSEETEGLRHEVRRIVKALYGTAPISGPQTLHAFLRNFARGHEVN